MIPARDALGIGQLTSLSAAVAISSVSGGIPAGTQSIVLQAESQDVRYRDDGTAPTASVGLILATKVLVEFTIGQAARMQVIESTASAKLNIAFYGTKTA